MNSSTTFVAAWTLPLETMAADTFIPDMSDFNGRMANQHQDGHIRARWHRGESTLAAGIRHCHTRPSPRMMVSGDIGYTSLSSLVRIDGTFNSARYISSVLRTLTLPFIRVLRNPAFKQDNERPHVAGIVRTFLDTENVRLFAWLACSSDLSPIENAWSMVVKRLARHHTPITTVDDLWRRVEAA
ncbi:transposable element Tcb1 transposase [Trichonephila clavipes]|nr:transposable element Tcb1 transposase [Trichonephila clavipes]